MGNFLLAFFESDTVRDVWINIFGFLNGVNVTKFFVSLLTLSFVIYIIRRVIWG